MNKEKIIEQIISILKKVDDEKALKEILSIARLIHNNYKLGK